MARVRFLLLSLIALSLLAGQSVRAEGSWGDPIGWMLEVDGANAARLNRVGFDPYCASLGGGYRFQSGFGLLFSLETFNCLLGDKGILSGLEASGFTVGPKWAFRPPGSFGRSLGVSLGLGWGGFVINPKTDVDQVVAEGDQVTAELAIGWVLPGRSKHGQFRPTILARKARSLQSPDALSGTSVGIGLVWVLDSDFSGELPGSVRQYSPPAPSVPVYERTQVAASRSGLVLRTSKLIDSVAPVPVPLTSSCAGLEVGWRFGFGLSVVWGWQSFHSPERVPSSRCQPRLTQVPAGLPLHYIRDLDTFGLQYTLDFESWSSLPVALTLGWASGGADLEMRADLVSQAVVQQLDVDVFEAHLEVTLMSSVRPTLGVRRVLGDGGGIGMTATLPMLGLLFVF